MLSHSHCLPRRVAPRRRLQAGYNLFFAETFPFIVMAANATLCFSLALLTAVMRPCCIGAVNIARGTGFTLAAYSQVPHLPTCLTCPGFPARGLAA